MNQSATNFKTLLAVGGVIVTLVTGGFGFTLKTLREIDASIAQLSVRVAVLEAQIERSNNYR